MESSLEPTFLQTKLKNFLQRQTEYTSPYVSDIFEAQGLVNFE